MSQETTLEKVSALLDPILRGLAIELVDLEYKLEGRDWFLRIFIDKEGGVNLDDCAAVSREIGTILEVEEVFSTAYRLEVSSPGLDRPLKTEEAYGRFVGHLVKIKTYEKIDPDGRGYERKTFVGTLESFEDGRVRVLQNDAAGGSVEFDLGQIAKANLEIEF